MVEGDGLLNRCTVKSRTEGSNPSLSAIFNFNPIDKGEDSISVDSEALETYVNRKAISVETQGCA